MKKLPLVARVLLGLIFVVFGLNGFFEFIPPPPDMPERLQIFMNGMLAGKYFFPLVKMTEVICGILLLSGAYVPLALVILAPVVINIFMVHAFLAPSGLPVALVLVALEAYLAFFVSPYNEPIKNLFKKHIA